MSAHDASSARIPMRAGRGSAPVGSPAVCREFVIARLGRAKDSS
jgi:hypothetical protein